MRRIPTKVLVISVLFCMLLTVPAWAEEATITGNLVNFRSGPGLNYEVTDCLLVGTSVTLNDSSNSEWYQITANGKTGYVSSKYVSVSAADDKGDNETTAPAAPQEQPKQEQTAQAAPAAGRTGSINAMYVRFRSAPSSDSTILGQYSTGTAVSVLAEEGSWVKCTIDGQSGYVYGQYVTISEAPAPVQETPAKQESTDKKTADDGNVKYDVHKTGYINSDKINFRYGPSSAYGIIATLNKNTQLEITGTSGKWTACNAKGYAGYVYSEYVTVTGEVKAPEAKTSNTDTKQDTKTETKQEVETVTYETHKTGYINADSINFRYGPASGYGRIAVLSKNTQVEITGTTGSWTACNAKGYAGYVYSEYVTVTGEVSVKKESSLPAGSAGTAVSGEVGYINSSSVHLRSGASTSYSILSTLGKNTEVIVTGSHGGWSSVSVNGKTGYVYSTYITLKSAAGTDSSSSAASGTKTGYIKGNSVRFRSKASTSSDVLGEFNYGTALSITGTSGDWTAVIINGKAGYIYSDYVAEGSVEVITTDGKGNGNAAGANSGSLGTQIANFALKYVGYPYVWGGNTPDGFDCSGFVSYVYAQFGYKLNRVADDQANKDGTLVTGDLKPGDILCFYSGSNYVGHVGIYIGDGRFVHASSSTTGVIISELSGYYTTRGYIAKRIV